MAAGLHSVGVVTLVGGIVQGIQLGRQAAWRLSCTRFGVVTLGGGPVQRNQTRSSSCVAAGVHSGLCRHIGWWHCLRKSNSMVVMLVGMAPRRFNKVKNLCLAGDSERVLYSRLIHRTALTLWQRAVLNTLLLKHMWVRLCSRSQEDMAIVMLTVSLAFSYTRRVIALHFGVLGSHVGLFTSSVNRGSVASQQSRRAAFINCGHFEPALVVKSGSAAFYMLVDRQS